MRSFKKTVEDANEADLVAKRARQYLAESENELMIRCKCRVEIIFEKSECTAMGVTRVGSCLAGTGRWCGWGGFAKQAVVPSL